MPRGVSRASIIAGQKAKVRQVLLEINQILPDGLKGLIEMVAYDLQQGNNKMATARCISMANRLDAAPTVQRKLGELLPGFAEFLKTRYNRAKKE